MVFHGDKLAYLMKIMGWSYQRVGEMTGLNPAHIHDLVHKTSNPRKDTVEKLCKGLNIDEHFFYLEESRLPVDVLPELPPELKRFIASGENTPWLALTERAKREGVSLEALQLLVDTLLDLSRK